MPERMDAGQHPTDQHVPDERPTDPGELEFAEQRPDQPVADHGADDVASEAEGLRPHDGADVPGATRHLDAGVHPHPVPAPDEQEQADPLG